MTSDRPYRNGMSREQALAVMQEVAGSQLDPKVVEVFISLAPEPVSYTHLGFRLVMGS